MNLQFCINIEPHPLKTITARFYMMDAVCIRLTNESLNEPLQENIIEFNNKSEFDYRNFRTTPACSNYSLAMSLNEV